jgi:hypothetical protein
MEEQNGTYRRQFLARSFKMTALLALGSISASFGAGKEYETT